MTSAPTGNDKPTNMWEELNRPKDRSSAAAEEPGSAPRDDSSDRGFIPVTGIVGGAIAVLAVAFAGFIVMGGRGAADGTAGNAPELAALVAEAEVSGDADGAPETQGETTAPSDSAAAESGDGAMGSEGDAGTEGDAYSPAVPAGAEGNYAVLSRGKLYLRGEIPSPLIEVGAVNALEQIMGAGNVVSEYVIDPNAEFVMGRATDVFIEDTVLFGTGSAEIAPDFYPLLGLGVVLMELQDGVTIEVYGHTDAIGSDDSNLLLSQARVDAVKAFWVSQGVDPERITAIGRGENDPVADDSTAEGRQLNRRVEVVISGFVFSV